MTLVIVSFPGSGRTWLRYALGVYLNQVNRTGLDPSDRQLLHPPGFQFCHDGTDGEPSELVAPPVMALLRNPRDVVVSWYHEKLFRHPALWNKPAPALALPEFLRHPAYGIPAIVAAYQRWLSTGPVVVQYESLLTDFDGALSDLLMGLGLPTIPGAIAYAKQHSAFQNMQALEAAGAIADPRLQPADRNNPLSWKTRRGQVGGFRDCLTSEDLDYIERSLPLEIRALGY